MKSVCQSDKRLDSKNAVLGLSSILFIKSELHCRRFAPLCNSEDIFLTFSRVFGKHICYLLASH